MQCQCENLACSSHGLLVNRCNNYIVLVSHAQEDKEREFMVNGTPLPDIGLFDKLADLRQYSLL